MNRLALCVLGTLLASDCLAQSTPGSVYYRPGIISTGKLSLHIEPVKFDVNRTWEKDKDGRNVLRVSIVAIPRHPQSEVTVQVRRRIINVLGGVEDRLIDFRIWDAGDSAEFAFFGLLEGLREGDDVEIKVGSRVVSPAVSNL